MEKLQLYRSSLVEWQPSPVIALAVSPDATRVAAARSDGSLEIWLVSPGSVGWHCQLTIEGNQESRLTSLVWCHPCSKSGVGHGWLLSSSIDGSISEWDLFSLQKKTVLDTVGVSIWQMAVEPSIDELVPAKEHTEVQANGYSDQDSHSDVESDESDDECPNGAYAASGNDSYCLALACDDGCIRMYSASDEDALTYKRSFPRVSGRLLSVAWSLNKKLIFSGSSDGLIRCWDAVSCHEVYRITVGLGGLGSSSELCVWSLLFLRCGTLVSGDSTGSIHFWDTRQGTLLQSHTYHRGDVNALATIPSHNRVFSAGSDGQVVLYKLSSFPGETVDASEGINKWVYVGYTRAHTHDIRALAVATPVTKQDFLPDEKIIKKRRLKKPLTFNYHKWAHVGVPMLLSAGDDTKIFAYSAREFTQFSPHDVCPAPQRPSVQLVHSTLVEGASLLLVQCSSWLDILQIMPSSKTIVGKSGTLQLVRVKSKESHKMICSTISSNGLLFAYSDHVKPNLFELRRNKALKNGWVVNKMKLPRGLPSVRSMVFSADSSRLITAGHDRKIYVVDVKSAEVTHTFIPRRKEENFLFQLSDPPITRMFASADGQWLAASNCYGDIYIFNLALNRQHWFISRLNGASVTAGGFPPKSSNVLVITTSANEVYVLDIDAKKLGEWSRQNTSLPRRFQEFPGEIIGLCFPPSDSSVVVYSSRAMCFVDFGMSMNMDFQLPNGLDLFLDRRDAKKAQNAKRKQKAMVEQLSKSNHNRKKNFDLCAFKDLVLFVGHLSDNSLFVLEKRWSDVVQTFDAPVHRHIYGA